MSKILLIVILILGFLVSLYLVGQKTNLLSKAGISNAPKEIRISNISDNSFTVSWITETAVPGFVNIGIDQNLDQTSIDDRNTDSQNAHFTHHITLKNLTPSTAYSFKIGSGANIYDNKGKIFTQTTAPTTNDTPPLPETLLGKVLKEDGKVASEALVYLELDKGSVLSSYTREEGNFLITLNNARTDDLSNYLLFDSNKKMKLSVQAGVEGIAKKDLNFSERVNTQTLTLQKTATTQPSWPGDLNGDGVVNVFDWSYYIKSKLGL